MQEVRFGERLASAFEPSSAKTRPRRTSRRTPSPTTPQPFNHTAYQQALPHRIPSSTLLTRANAIMSGLSFLVRSSSSSSGRFAKRR